MKYTADANLRFSERKNQPVPLLRLAVVVVLVSILHGLLFRRLRVLGFGPDLFMTLAVVGGLEFRIPGGPALGILAGLGADFVGSRPIGLWAFVGGTVGFLVGAVADASFGGPNDRSPYLLAWLGAVMSIPLYFALVVAISNGSFPRLKEFGISLLIIPLWSVVFVAPLRAFVRLLMKGAS